MADYGSAGFILSMVSIPFFIIGFLGNVLVVRIVYKTPEMHSVTNYLLANLAVSDGLAIFYIWPSLLTHDSLKPGIKVDCRLAALCFTVPVSSLTLMVLAI